MNRKETLRSYVVFTDSKRGEKTGKEVKRQDWGYTDQYRRMMQRDKRKKADAGEEA